MSDRRFLALGDSYTIGESVPVAARWPVRLMARLTEAGDSLGAPQIIAKTGWTTDELDAAIDHAKPKGPFDLVTLLIGVNNQYRGRPVAELRKEFRALLQRAIVFADGHPQRVIVLSIPDWGVTPFAAGRDRAAIAAAIDSCNAAERDETKRAGAWYVDVTPVSREAATDSSLVAEDGLHPSEKMYERWVDLTLETARTALKIR